MLQSFNYALLTLSSDYPRVGEYSGDIESIPF